ncbi:MAG: prenyltransferase/squalene oxidase repeat-containing protein [bacterium]
MNDQEFSLLVEEYLDGSLSPDGRTALGAEVRENPARRQLFEEQARLHIRIHAQTSRIDFTESQHIAIMVMDIAEKHRDPNTFMDTFRRKTLRERLALIVRGLHAAKGTPAHHAAREELTRTFGPVSISMMVNVAIIVLILFWVPYALPPREPTEGTVVTIGSDEPQAGEPSPEPTPPEPPPTGAPEPAGPLMPPQEPPPIPVEGGNRIPDPKIAGWGNDPGEVNSEPISLGPIIGTSKPIIPGTIGPRDDTQRSKILMDNMATPTEAAVGKSLAWLKAKQSPDGSWPGQDTTAMTGLALLAYLAHNETTSSPEFGLTVEKGIKHILAGQTGNGKFSNNVYTHAIATYAIAEAFTMTRIMSLKQPLESAVRVILDGQQSYGGFDYDYRKDQRFDTSVTGWQVQALKAAKVAGVDNPNLDRALARSARFLQYDAYANDGSGFVYEGKAGSPTQAGGRASMTGVGTLCLQMLGKATSPQVRSGLRTLKNATLDWPAKGKAGVYAGYYIAQAKYHAGDKLEWLRWNRQMQKTLLARQYADGHWEQGDYDNGSHVYTTTLCTLMLEVYYRYLPTTLESSRDAGSTESMTSGDVPVNVR